MKNSKLLLVSALAFLSIASSAIAADDLDRLAGKWSVKKTNDEGQTYTQTIEIQKDKFTFQMIGADDTVFIHAVGDVKLEKLGPFHSIKFHNIRAGASEADLQPIDDDRAAIYQLGYSTWTMASNFDAERDQAPSVDVYRKVAK